MILQTKVKTLSDQKHITNECSIKINSKKKEKLKT